LIRSLRTRLRSWFPSGPAEILTLLAGWSLQGLYGRDKKLHPLLRRLLLFVPEHFILLGHVPFLRDRLPVFDPGLSNFSMIPVNRDIEGAGETVLPLEIVDALIERSSHRVIMTRCLCRHNYDCGTYPDDFGCLFLGASALEAPKGWRRIVSREEARAHARRGVELGLVPMVGKIRFDSDTLMIRDRGKLLTICFCCACCCLTRFMARGPAELIDSMQHPVEGLSLEVTDACTGCGTCVETCYLQAIEVREGRAVRKPICRLCGRCAAHCPQKAIRLRLENPNAVQDVVHRILSVVEI